MDAILSILENVGLFLAGMAVRVGLVLAVIAALLVPVLAWGGLKRAWIWARRHARGLVQAGGLVYDPELRYAPGHTWLRPDGTRLRVGVDDLAQGLLPWAVSVQLPQPGTRVRAGATAAIISCGDREARIASPVDGTVSSVNTALLRDPALVKRDAYGRGWLFAVEPADRTWAGFPTGAAAGDWLRREHDRLGRRIELQLGVAAADGGEWVAPPHTFLTRDEWQNVTRSFLAPNGAACRN